MSWVRVDDSIWSHPKMLELPAGAVRLWLFAMCWSGQHLSDGRVSHACVKLLGGRKSDVKSLVSAGLWEEADDGFQIHNYLEFQPSREKVQAEREAAKRRMKRVRSPELRPNFDGSSPSPSHPIPSHVSEKKDPSLSGRPREEAPPGSFSPRSAAGLMGLARARADVRQLHEVWRATVGQPEHSLDHGAHSPDAEVLAECIDQRGLDVCLLVARNCHLDGMVSGRADERGRPHKTIRYVFGNPDTFHRILADTRKREGQDAGRVRASQAVREAKAL